MSTSRGAGGRADPAEAVLIPLTKADARCGAKAAGLAWLLRAGFPVPAGFVITDALRDDSWVQTLEQALPGLAGRSSSGRFAVRSSAHGEDGAGATFAGQLDTTLDVVAAHVAREVRSSAASGNGARAVAYTARTGQAPGPVVPVIVQVMVDAEVAGVLFTRHPLTGADQAVIEAGRGDEVVSGSVTPQRWTVDGSAVTGPRDVTEPILTTEQVLTLAETGRRIEASFGCPQDIEWAIADGTTWMLQARPVTTNASAPAHPVRNAGDALLSGAPASPGVVTGCVRIIGGLGDFARFRSGDVLVCRTTSPAWTPLLACAAAVVTETGGILAHAAIVAREFGIPAVTATCDAMTVLSDGQQVTVDGTHGTIALCGAAAVERAGERS